MTNKKSNENHEHYSVYGYKQKGKSDTRSEGHEYSVYHQYAAQSAYNPVE